MRNITWNRFLAKQSGKYIQLSRFGGD